MVQIVTKYKPTV